MNSIVYGKKRQVVGYYQDPDNGAYMRILLDGGQAYVFAAASLKRHYDKMLETPTEVREAPDGNRDILTFADGTQVRAGGWVMPFTKTDAEYMTAMQQADAAPKPKTKPERKPRKQWSKNAQDKIAAIWVEWRLRHNTKERGGREVDCFNRYKAELPDCIETFRDFHDCKECARKNGLIPKHNRKRRKSAG